MSNSPQGIDTPLQVFSSKPNALIDGLRAAAAALVNLYKLGGVFLAGNKT